MGGKSGRKKRKKMMAGSKLGEFYWSNNGIFERAYWR